MVTTRSRSQGSPQVRDLEEEIGESRKRRRTEHASPIQVKKRSQSKKSTSAIQISAEASDHAGSTITSGYPLEQSSNVREERADEPSSLDLALRQRDAGEDRQAPSSSGKPLQRSKHVRFGSEDLPNINSPSEQNSSSTTEQFTKPAADVDDSPTSDEDESPETITTAKSQAQARVAEEGAARAIRKKQKAEKELRKQRDSKLKQQAQDSSSRRKRPYLDTVSLPKTTNVTDQLAQQLLQKEQMPDFLPKEILDAKPNVASLQLANTKTLPASRNRKTPDANSRHPVELVRQGRIVKILEQTSSAHPPPAAASSKIVRERWLAGQRRNDSSVAARRKPLGKGFVTR